jgi:hypothetical protein
MRLVLLGGRIMALMGRVGRPVGDPGGEMVMSLARCISRSLFMVSVVPNPRFAFRSVVPYLDPD